MCNKYEPSKGLAIFKAKCPQCQSGKMFKKSALQLNGFTEMFDTCSVCGLTFEVEPGFFWGAMYVSYGLGVAFAIAAFVISYVILETTVKTAFISIIVTLILLLPVMMRYSRNIWINMFVSFDKNWKEKFKKETK